MNAESDFLNSGPTWHALVEELSAKQINELRYMAETGAEDRDSLIDAAFAFLGENRHYFPRGPMWDVAAAQLAIHVERSSRITFAEMDEFLKVRIGVNMFGFETLWGRDIAQTSFDESERLRESVSNVYVAAVSELFEAWPVDLVVGDPADFPAGDDPWWVVWVRAGVGNSTVRSTSGLPHERLANSTSAPSVSLTDSSAAAGCAAGSGAPIWQAATSAQI